MAHAKAVARSIEQVLKKFLNVGAEKHIDGLQAIIDDAKPSSGRSSQWGSADTKIAMCIVSSVVGWQTPTARIEWLFTLRTVALAGQARWGRRTTYSRTFLSAGLALFALTISTFALDSTFSYVWQVWLAILGAIGCIVSAFYVTATQVLRWPAANHREHLWTLVAEATKNAIDLCIYRIEHGASLRGGSDMLWHPELIADGEGVGRQFAVEGDEVDKSWLRLDRRNAAAANKRVVDNLWIAICAEAVAPQ